MKTQQQPCSRPHWALNALCALLVSAPVLAADTATDSELRYQRDAAACRESPAGTDRAACLREAGAVRESKDRMHTTPHAERLSRNALKRCEPLPQPDRLGCVERVQGRGTTSGSVAGGGIYRELVETEITLPKASPAAGAPTK